MASTPPPPHAPLPHLSDVEQLFHYDPMQSLAVAAVVVFFVIAVVQFVLWWQNRPDRFMLVIALTALIGESLGYVVRIATIHNPTKGLFIITTLLILLSPCALALVNYIVCGRILAFTGLNVGCLRPNWIAKAFLLSDVVTFLVQGFGGALTISDNANTVTAGQHIVTAGLALQVASFALFVYVSLCIQFMERYGFRESPTANKAFWAMHGTMLLLIIRTIYRLIEFNMGVTGYVSTHEWTFYAFDAGAMLIAFILYSWPSLHFGKCVNDLGKEREQAPVHAGSRVVPVADVEMPGAAKPEDSPPSR